MNKIKKIAVLLSAIFLATSAACSGKNTVSDEKTIKVLYSGFVNGSVPGDHENNPYKKYIDETYDVDYQLSLTADMSNEILKRYSSSRGDKPDVIMFSDYTDLQALYNQGFFVEDYTPYLDYMPNIRDFYKETKAISSIYQDGKLSCIAYPCGGWDWEYRIRRDWVKEWNEYRNTPGYGNPKTADDLLEMARWVKTAKGNNYYMFTSAGSQEGLGYIKQLLYMFTEYEDFYVDASGNINHPILDGSYKKFLDYLKIIVEEKHIDPDWYIQSWGNHKTKLQGGYIGMDWYTPVIAIEYMEGGNGSEAERSNIWTTLHMPTDTEGVARQGFAYSHIGYKFAVSKTAAKSEEKMKKICRIINDMIYQPDQTLAESMHYKLRWGLDIDNYTIGSTEKENELEKILDSNGTETGFYAYYVKVNSRDHKKSSNGSLWDYGVPIQNADDKVIEYGQSKTYGQSAFDYIAMFNETDKYYESQTKPNYSDMISLTPKVVTNINAVIEEFAINYVRGTATRTYSEFVEYWKKSGAEALMTMAEAQLKQLGYIQ